MIWRYDMMADLEEDEKTFQRFLSKKIVLNMLCETENEF